MRDSLLKTYSLGLEPCLCIGKPATISVTLLITIEIVKYKIQVLIPTILIGII